ncbi:calcium-binding protein [Inquilinus limosus]|uniref:calcium-binding protein n=1 Tax=Inquilinus limosus TaxID=171674 RepID=UPI003F134DFE
MPLSDDLKRYLGIQNEFYGKVHSDWLGRQVHDKDKFVGTDLNDYVEARSGGHKSWTNWIFSADGFEHLDGGGGNNTLGYLESPEAVNVSLGVQLETELQNFGAIPSLFAHGVNFFSNLLLGIDFFKITNEFRHVQTAGGDAQYDAARNFQNVVGSAFNDVLGGDAHSNKLLGMGGNDVIAGGGGDDFLIGGDGSDALQGGDGADVLDGGSGLDVASYAAAGAGVTASLLSPSQNTGSARGDRYVGIEDLLGSQWNDRLTGDRQANHLIGQNGNDVIDGDDGNDALFGGDGDDRLTGRAGADRLDGGGGFDTAVYEGSLTGVTIDLRGGIAAGGDAQGDTFNSIEGLRGSASADTLHGDDGTNAIGGRSGNDAIDGGGGHDNLWGERGNDTLRGGTGDDKLEGGGGADILDGGSGTDSAYYDKSGGGVTIDLAAGTAAGGEAQGDRLIGVENIYGAANYGDRITGDAAANFLVGLGGNDVLDGGVGNDRLDGGLEDDRLTGGAGADLLKGSLGAEIFVYRSVADSTIDRAGRDTIVDFYHSQGDRIDLSAIDADGNAANGNNAFTFIAGGVFTGAGHELIALAGAGKTTVYGDIDGDGQADFAIDVQAKEALTAADFLL